ncbi:MAG: HAMP domain-containing histidine kinase [Clostridium sp.]|nr:HAMP domain-containing histidine kinase [Clostridium sp.]
MFNKKDKGTSFFSLLIKNQIIFTLIFLALAALFYIITTLCIINLTYEPNYSDLVNEINNLESGNYSRIPLQKYLRKDYEMIIFDECGEKIYSSSKNKSTTFSVTELNYIPDIEDEYYYSLSRYQTLSGPKWLLLRFDEAKFLDSDAYASFDRNLYVTEGNLFEIGKKFTERSLQLYMGRYDEDYAVRKIMFFTNSGEVRYAVFIMKMISGKQYEKLSSIWENSWISFIFAYILMMIFSMFWLNKRIKKLLDPLNSAIVGYMNNENTDLHNYSGPNEFLDIANNFSALAKRLDESELEREEVSKAKKKMLADISHDLKTPITVIKGYSRAIRDGMVPKDQLEKYLDTIVKRADTLSELIDTFSEYSKLEHPEFILDMEYNNICEFCKEILADKYQELECGGYSLEVDIPDEEIYCKFDCSHMKRVIENIIGNSVKYNPNGTSLYFSLYDEKDNIKITIGDNGCGISDEIASTIFTPFVIGDESRSNKQGTGLGLAIVKEIVEKHGGKISLIQDEKLKYKVLFIIYIPKSK